jgi:hypothetical protein
MTHLGRSDALIKLTTLVLSLMISYLCSFKQNRLFSARRGSPPNRTFSNRRPQFTWYAVQHLPLLPRWHYSPMRIFASLMDFSQWAPFFFLPFPVFKFGVLKSVCTQFRHLFSCRLLCQLRYGSLWNTWLHCASKLPDYYCFRQHIAVFWQPLLQTLVI